MSYINRTDGGTLSTQSAHKWFKYSKETGRIFRLTNNGKLKEVGTIRPDGHRIIGYNRKSYRTTTLIWLLIHNRKPIGVIDHINGNPSDDRLFNLRECTQSQNMINTGVTTRSKSGVKGVSWDKDRQKWVVYIGKNYKSYFIGRFDSLEVAEEAYKEARENMYGEFFQL